MNIYFCNMYNAAVYLFVQSAVQFFDTRPNTDDIKSWKSLEEHDG